MPTLFCPNGSYGLESREGQFESFFRMQQALYEQVADDDVSERRLEIARVALVKYVANMDTSFDTGLTLLRTIGVNPGFPSEQEWLDILGLGSEATVRFGGSNRQVTSASMYLNYSPEMYVKPYVGVAIEGCDGVHFSGVLFARDGLKAGMRVVTRQDEAASTIHGHSSL